MNKSVSSVVKRCEELRAFWSVRDSKMRQWYRLIQMIDELKTEKMESFVGNDPRAMYNLVLHMLDADVPHRLRNIEDMSVESADASYEVSRFFDMAWEDVENSFRHSGPRQSLKRSLIGLLLATGWYAVFSFIYDDGSKAYLELWNPIQAYPMWEMDMDLSECAHISTQSDSKIKALAKTNNWTNLGNIRGDILVYDYWWTEIDSEYPYSKSVWNSIVVNNTLVKFEKTRFSQIPIFIAPVGGLPDTGPLSEGSFPLNSSGKDTWKGEIGQSIVATNENIYRTWNKWWSFSLQLLRDTAQPRIFERSRSGKNIVKPEDVFRRGAIFRGGTDDSVEFLNNPPMPLELRATQLDLEAMMQRGGPSWAMYGNVSGELSAYVMSQISASANQVLKPYHSALQYLYGDIDNFWMEDILDRGVRPYNWKKPKNLPKNCKISAKYDIEIPGDLIQRATSARMIDPEFALSYSYVVNKLFPDIKNPLQERARRLADMAELSPENALIAKIRYFRKQAAVFEMRDEEVARLYNAAADAAEMQLNPQSTAKDSSQDNSRVPGNRLENAPKSVTQAQMPV